jgi:alkyldihydroxyacetonephosphate synthase
MADLLTHSIPRSVWHGWGDPAEAHRLPDHAWAYLTERVGAGRLDHPHRPVAIEKVVLPEATLAGSVRAALEGVVGADHVRDDRAARVEHAGGKSFADLVRIRRGDGSHAPDAVVYPGTPAEVQQVLQICASLP